MIKFLKQNQLEENAIPFYILSSNKIKEDCWITKKKKQCIIYLFRVFLPFLVQKNSTQ